MRQTSKAHSKASCNRVSWRSRVCNGRSATTVPSRPWGQTMQADIHAMLLSEAIHLSFEALEPQTSIPSHRSVATVVALQGPLCGTGQADGIAQAQQPQS